MLFAPELQRDMLNCLPDVAVLVGCLMPGSLAIALKYKVAVQPTSYSTRPPSSRYQVSTMPSHLDICENNEIEPADPYIHGRYLADYRDLGFVSTDAVNCVSRHLEAFAIGIYCLAEQIAIRHC